MTSPARNILLAKLECHHDHLRDEIWKRADELFGANWKDSAPPGALLLFKHVRDLATRFSTALICSECNAADGTVKAKLRPAMDPRFTFTVTEISGFIRSTPNTQHEIDVGKARQIWNEQKSAFEHRLRLIDQLLSDARSGRLARDTSGWADARRVETAMQGPALLHQAFLRKFQGTEKTQQLEGLYQEFLNRSKSRDSARLAPRVNQDGKPPPAPTDEEFLAYSDPNSPKWAAAPSDWRCPLCDRDKRSVMRLSNKRRWSGGIREIFVCRAEENSEATANRRALFPGFPNDRFVAEMSTVLVCSDCADIPKRLGQHDPSFGRTYLQPDDIRASLLAIKPNAQHLIDFETASQCATANASLEAAIEAFNCYRAKASVFATQYELWRRSAPHETILAELCEDIRVFHGIESLDECRRLAEWLLTSGQRLSRD